MQNDPLQTGNNPSQQETGLSINQSCNKLEGPITRDEIRTVLKRVYAAESKPIPVGSIRHRTAIALGFIYVGTIIILAVFGMKYLALETSQLIPGLVILVLAFMIGFIISTKDIRKIYRSMNRFKDQNTLAYRRVFTRSKWRLQAIAYATVVCLVFLGAQTLNLFVVNDGQTMLDEGMLEKKVTFKEDMIWIEDIILGETYESAGQQYRWIVIEINNSQEYFGQDLLLELQSHFAGEMIDKFNMTLDEPDSNIIIEPIKIHEPDDTSIYACLKHINEYGEKTFDNMLRHSENDIYITKAIGRITKTSPITKAIEITVVVYNDGNLREPESLSVIVSNPILLGGSYYRDSIKNNETLYHGQFWEMTFKFDILLDEDSEFDVKLNVKEETKEETKDQTRVDAS